MPPVTYGRNRNIVTGTKTRSATTTNALTSQQHDVTSATTPPTPTRCQQQEQDHRNQDTETSHHRTSYFLQRTTSRNANSIQQEPAIEKARIDPGIATLSCSQSSPRRSSEDLTRIVLLTRLSLPGLASVTCLSTPRALRAGLCRESDRRPRAGDGRPLVNCRHFRNSS